jgi:hypothetical protein
MMAALPLPPMNCNGWRLSYLGFNCYGWSKIKAKARR